MEWFTSQKKRIVGARRAVPGRDDATPVQASHLVLGTKTTSPERAVPAFQGPAVACPVGLSDVG
jgi:hypothetical protein